MLIDGSKKTFNYLALFGSRLVADFCIESFAKLVNLGGAEGRVFLVAEVVAGVWLAQSHWIVKADGCATMHLRLPLLLHEAQAVEDAGEFAARDVLAVVC